ncbi:MAG: heavy-metal-associated domain-containing protein [Bacteroidales bacterium]|jgi:copper chaperone CopZ|nr:heavy-metal-associated domain-containing protein [Bacteroidales bacterium]
MRKNLVLLCLFLFTGLNIAELKANMQSQATEKTSNKETVTFYISVHCANCLKRIDKNLPFIKGVLDYKTNLDQKSITITYDKRKANEATLKQELEKLDFIVTKDRDELLKRMK